MYPPTIAELTPDAHAYEMADSGEVLTFGQLDAQSNQVAHLLHNHGVRPGDSLVILLPNGIAWPVVVAAGMRSGLEVTPMNWHLKSTELAPMLREAAPAAVVTNVDMAPLVIESTSDAARPPLVLTVSGACPGAQDLWSSLQDLPATPIRQELLGEATREGHEVVGGDGTCDDDGHAPDSRRPGPMRDRSGSSGGQRDRRVS